MGAADFPDVNTDAINTLATDLGGYASGFADTGIEVQNLRDAVIQNEQWAGPASQQWHAVVTERVGDAGYTDNVIGQASSTLSTLASDLAGERRTYNNILQQISAVELKQVDPFSYSSPQLDDPQGYKALCASVSRANELLDQAAKDLLGFSVMAGDIRAQPAANRTPGVPDGTNRNPASLSVLGALFGSVLSNQKSGTQFEKDVLNELGITKNTEVWRPDPAFEGRLTATGLAKGTTPDGLGSNFLLEIKGTDSQTVRFQLRLMSQYAKLSGRPMWMIKQGTNKVTDNLRDLAEGTGGGVIYRTAAGQYQDADGNPVTVSYDKATNKLEVTGYQPSGGASAADPSSVAAPDGDAPAAPVDPSIADPPVDPVDPVDPIGPEDPIDPIDPIDPFIP
jgi:hypothetical protein